MIDLLKDSGLALVLLVLPLTIVANILIGAAMAGINVKDQFDKNKLLKGLLKGTLVYSGVLIYALVSYLMKDLTINFSGEELGLVDAMYMVILATIVKYAKDGIDKLVKIVKFKENEQETFDENEEEDINGGN